MNLKAFFIGVTAAVASLTTLNSQTLFVPGANGNTPGIGVSTNGNVGVGTSSPGAMISIKTPDYNTTGLVVESDNASIAFGNHSIGLTAKSTWSKVPYIYWNTPAGLRQAYLGWETSYFNLTLENGFNFSINGGNLLIGKTTQTNTAYKLDVAGKIRANEIVVNTTGADFVFDSTYNLRSLPELETFIKQNKHLPEIAPAKEMQENGVSAGEMQTKLLQKIEELTLYVIELKKENEELKKEKDLQLAEQKETLDMVIEEIKSLKAKMNQ